MPSTSGTGQIAICNLALSRLGVSQRMAAMNENTAQADAISGVWDVCLDECLYEGYWSWAAKAAALALIVDQSTLATSALFYPGWRYVYGKPSDAVRIVGITTYAGMRTIPYMAYWWERTFPILGPYRPTWQEAESSDGSSRVLMTDQDSAWVVYTSRVTNTDAMDPKFKSLLAWKLAVEAAGPLKASASIVQTCAAGYNATLMEALAANMNEQQPDAYPESPSITVRG